MKNLSALALLFVLGCGRTADDPPATGAPTPPPVAAPAAEAPAAEAPAAEPARSCRLRTLCREYRTLPVTITSADGARSMTITAEMAQQECEGRRGEWRDGPCDTTGVLASCHTADQIKHYYDADGLEASRGICVDLDRGEWRTP